MPAPASAAAPATRSARRTVRHSPPRRQHWIWLLSAEGKAAMIYVKAPSPHSSQTREEAGRRVPASFAGAAPGGAGLCTDLERLSPEGIYRTLMEACALGCDAFDAHVVASILAVSSTDGGAAASSQTASVGLSAVQFSALIAQFFPKAAAWRL